LVFVALFACYQGRVSAIIVALAADPSNRDAVTAGSYLPHLCCVCRGRRLLVSPGNDYTGWKDSSEQQLSPIYTLFCPSGDACDAFELWNGCERGYFGA
jgi:hypothetical protein